VQQVFKKDIFIVFLEVNFVKKQINLCNWTNAAHNYIVFI